LKETFERVKRIRKPLEKKADTNETKTENLETDAEG